MEKNQEVKGEGRNLDLREIIDRQEIVDLLTRYTVALDSQDWALLKTCFTDDAVADYGPEAGRHEGYPAIEKIVQWYLEGLDASQHLIGNFVIEVDRNRARSACYLQAQHYLLDTEGGDTYTVGGTYEDDLIRTDEGWKIKYRRLHTTWKQGNEGLFEAAQARKR